MANEPNKPKENGHAKEGGNVYQIISLVRASLSKEGIAKNRDNTQQEYKFRGIDDIFNAISPVLSEHGLCIIPYVLGRNVTERQSRNGGVLFSVAVQVRFDFISIHDGTKHEVMMYGEAMDSGDKATNKALSAAYKYACLQTFSIPTEGDNDADKVTHEVIPVEAATPVYTPTDTVRPYKDKYVVPANILPNGTLDFDTFVGDIELLLENAANPQDVSLLNRSNAKTIRQMEKERPDLFAHIGQKFRETAQSLM